METSPDKDELDRIVDLLKFDYQVSRSLIDKFENHIFLVRNWAVTTTGAIVALALSVDQQSILVVGLVTAIFFALLELIYQCWVLEAIAYSNHIETQIQRVALKKGTLDPHYEFGVRGWIHRPGLKNMIKIFVRRREILTFYVGLLLVPVIGMVIYPR